MAHIDEEASRSSLDEIDEEEQESAALWPHSHEPKARQQQQPQERWTPHWQSRRLVYLNIAMLCCSAAMLVLAGILRYGAHSTRHCADDDSGRNALLKKTSAYSPLLDELDIPLVTVQGSSFFDNSSIFRQLPSAEVDAAWDRIAPTTRGFYLTSEQVTKLGKDPQRTVRSNKHPDLHIGIINGMHELHCLNLIRKNLHRDYYWPEGIRYSVHWIHLYHCMEVVTQALTCSGNMDVVTFNWMETQGAPFFDFEINRVCRDFDRILEWQTDMLADMEQVHRVAGNDDGEIEAPDLLHELNAQLAEGRAYRHEDPAFVGIGL